MWDRMTCHDASWNHQRRQFCYWNICFWKMHSSSFWSGGYMYLVEQGHKIVKGSIQIFFFCHSWTFLNILYWYWCQCKWKGCMTQDRSTGGQVATTLDPCARQWNLWHDSGSGQSAYMAHLMLWKRKLCWVPYITENIKFVTSQFSVFDFNRQILIGCVGYVLIGSDFLL
jgi:hypothetical protein